MEENLDSPPPRRAAERRTRSSRAKVPRGSPASREQQQSIRLVTNAWTRVSMSRSCQLMKAPGHLNQLVPVNLHIVLLLPGCLGYSYGTGSFSLIRVHDDWAIW